MVDDMTSNSLWWKIRKALRYLRLFGPTVTVEKVRAQYHMKKVGDWSSDRYTNPDCRDPESDRRTVAIIGCGKFAYSVIGHYLKEHEPNFLRWTLDIDHGHARSLCDRFGGAFATRLVDDIADDPKVDLVYIASNHASHSEYAVRLIRAGKAVHIEKPHAVSGPQLDELVQTMRQHPSVPVFLGFNRPRSSHYQKAKVALAGASGPMMVNWFIAGHEIAEDHWYFAPREGGRVLGNLCHWLDLSMQLVGEEKVFPCEMVPTSPPDSRSDYVLTLKCHDGSLIILCFSAKGHTFEGVREVMSAHRGSAIVLLRDFKETRIENGVCRSVRRTRYRDHGHRSNVLASYERRREAGGESLDYVYRSGIIAIAAREALESGDAVNVEGTAG